MNSFTFSLLNSLHFMDVSLINQFTDQFADKMPARNSIDRCPHLASSLQNDLSAKRVVT